MTKIDLSWRYYRKLVKDLITKIYTAHSIDLVVAIGRGGIIPALLFSHSYDISLAYFSISRYSKTQGRKVTTNGWAGFKKAAKNIVLLDDLVDKGITMQFATQQCLHKNPLAKIWTAVLFKKSCTKYQPDFYIHQLKPDEWVVFPYENQ